MKVVSACEMCGREIIEEVTGDQAVEKQREGFWKARSCEDCRRRSFDYYE